jgi:hypothetical protein
MKTVLCISIRELNTHAIMACIARRMLIDGEDNVGYEMAEHSEENGNTSPNAITVVDIKPGSDFPPDTYTETK